MLEYVVFFGFGFFVVFWVLSSLNTDLDHLYERVDGLKEEINELGKEKRVVYLIEEFRAEVMLSRLD